MQNEKKKVIVCIGMDSRTHGTEEVKMTLTENLFFPKTVKSVRFIKHTHSLTFFVFVHVFGLLLYKFKFDKFFCNFFPSFTTTTTRSSEHECLLNCFSSSKDKDNRQGGIAIGSCSSIKTNMS